MEKYYNIFYHRLFAGQQRDFPHNSSPLSVPDDAYFTKVGLSILLYDSDHRKYRLIMCLNLSATV